MQFAGHRRQGHSVEMKGLSQEDISLCICFLSVQIDIQFLNSISFYIDLSTLSPAPLVEHCFPLPVTNSFWGSKTSSHIQQKKLNQLQQVNVLDIHADPAHHVVTVLEGREEECDTTKNLNPPR